MIAKIRLYVKRALVCMLISLSFMESLQYAKASENEQYLPELKGKMVYHTYSDYDKRDSKIYVFDFETKENICISDKFQGVYNTMNADFKNDGSEIVFAGMVDNKMTEEWDVFHYNLETNQLDNLTKGNKLRDEDPKYSPDGTKVIFKQGHWNKKLGEMVYDIMEMDLVTGKLRSVTNDLDEDSMPYYASDGKSVYYAKGLGKTSQINNVSLEETDPITKVWAEKDIYCYYPIVYKDTLYFSKWYSPYNKSDTIIKLDLTTNKITIPSFNSENYNCSDACPVSDRFIIISSTMPGGKGGYDLYIADVTTGNTYSLDLFNKGINNDKDQLGASYYVKE